MGIKQQDIDRAIAEGNKVLQQLRQTCPIPHEPEISPELQRPQPQRHQAPALVGADAGKAQSDDRIIVRFIGRRTRPLDPDNFAGGCKDLLDGLRHAGLIPGDRPDQIVFVTEQIKVSHRWQESTVIELLA